MSTPTGQTWLVKNLTLTVVISLILSPCVGAQEVSFRNIATSVGIDYSYSVGVAYGAGITFCDFNGDGLDDLSFPTGAGEKIYLLQNTTQAFEDIADRVSLPDSPESKAIIWADYDNDGDKDFILTNIFGQNKLYKNDSNNFVDVTVSAGISSDFLPSMGACWADYDNDGWLDLYILNYSGFPGVGNTRNYLYQNQGDGTFSDVTLTANVGDWGKHAFTAVFFDYNNDGWQDIYIANDRSSINTLFKNLGNGTFEDVSIESGSNLDFDAMGIAVGDYNNDGWLDLYVSNGPVGNGLLRNNGDGSFTDVAEELGVLVEKGCWGVNFFDYDNDSDLDLYVAASIGQSPGSPDKRNILFENRGDGTFVEASAVGLDNDNYQSYGTAIGDHNNDGYPDIAVLNANRSVSLWESSGGSNNWVKLELQGTESNRDGTGSLIEVYRSGSKFIRSVHCGASFMSQDSQIQTIGVGATTTIDSIVVTWPSGTISLLKGVQVGQKLRIVENQVSTHVADPQTAPNQFVLYANYPNPFNPTTTISLYLPQPERVEIRIYNAGGQEVRTLLSEPAQAGLHQIKWDGRNYQGHIATSGVYFTQVKAGEFVATQKMLLIR